MAANLPAAAGWQPLPRHRTRLAGTRRVGAALDPEAFQACLLAWVRTVLPGTAGQVVAPDGKTLRRSHERSNGKAALHMASAWACGSRLVPGRVAVAERSNESAAIPALRRRLDLEGARVTIDAMGCQAAIAAQRVAQGADYALAWQKNHPTPHEEVAPTFAQARQAAAGTPPGTADSLETVEKDHGRLALRRPRTRRDPAVIADLDPRGAWAHPRALGLRARRRQVGDRHTTGCHY